MIPAPTCGNEKSSGPPAQTGKWRALSPPSSSVPLLHKHLTLQFSAVNEEPIFIRMLKMFSRWWIIFFFCTQMSNLRAFALKTNTIRLNSVTNTVCGIGLVCTQQHVSQMRLSKFILQPNSLSEKLMFVCTWKLSLRAPSPSPNQSHWIGHLFVLRWEVTANLAAGKWLQSFIHGRKASAEAPVLGAWPVNKGNRFDRTCFSGQTVSALMPHAIMPPPVSNRLLPLLNLTSWLCHLVLSPLVVLLSVLSGRLFIPEALQTQMLHESRVVIDSHQKLAA